MAGLCIKREIVIWMLVLLAVMMIHVMGPILGCAKIQIRVILAMRLVILLFSLFNCFFFLASNDDVEIESKCSNLLVSVASDTFAELCLNDAVCKNNYQEAYAETILCVES